MANERNLTGNRDKDGNLLTINDEMLRNVVDARKDDKKEPPLYDENMVEDSNPPEVDYTKVIEALLKAKPEDVDDILTQFDSTAKDLVEGFGTEQDLQGNPDVLDYLNKLVRYEDELSKVTTKVPKPEGMMKLNVKP